VLWLIFRGRFDDAESSSSSGTIVGDGEPVAVRVSADARHAAFVAAEGEATGHVEGLVGGQSRILFAAGSESWGGSETTAAEEGEGEREVEEEQVVVDDEMEDAISEALERIGRRRQREMVLECSGGWSDEFACRRCGASIVGMFSVCDECGYDS
jgi:hypothetical protein